MKTKKHPKNHLNNTDLDKQVIKGIKDHTRHELFKMASICQSITKSPDLPLEWRKKDDNSLLQFIIKNKDVKLSVIYKKLK